MQDAIGSFPSGGEFSVADLSVYLCIIIALFSLLSLGKRRYIGCKIMLMLIVCLGISYEILDYSYDIITVSTTNYSPLFEHYDRAWTWFESAVANAFSLTIVLSHIGAAHHLVDNTAPEYIPGSCRYIKSRDLKFVYELGVLLFILMLISLTESIICLYKVF